MRGTLTSSWKSRSVKPFEFGKDDFLVSVDA
ncbi:hypothetical protein [Mordavella massiliensis]